MFELSVAKKYLIPRKKQLSVSLIAVMSVTVISLVVWLILVFLSVTDGIERNWLQKLTALNAPLRITPTEKYYTSYYYQIDALSLASEYAHKTIGEKLHAPLTDPYSPEEDAELPLYWPPSDHKDPVKEIFRILADLKHKQSDLAFQDYELSGALMRLEFIRPPLNEPSFLTQISYLASFSDQSPYLRSLLLESIDSLPHEGILLAKSLQDSGIRVGDRGYLAYPGANTEQKLPVHVAGFYDPGVMAVGNRYILVHPSVTRSINASSNTYAFDRLSSNGILVWFKDLNSAPKMKADLEKALEQAGLSSYWKISTFREYDFAKDLLQQFQSDKYLFTLLAGIILIVACCNIISLLVLLVNDKKREIGILQAMGASSKSIASIFGLCGILMGIASCLIGVGAALLTLHNIDYVVRALSLLQGHDAFNVAFFGKSLPSELSSSALLFVLIATPLLSLAAGLVPAIKACSLRPSTILRSE